MNSSPDRKGEVHLKELFKPAQIGSMTLRNRIIMMPMLTDYGSPDGFVTQRIKDYYEARAKGGACMIFVESTCVDTPRGKIITGQISIDHDKFLPGLTELADAAQQHGAKIAVQLHHAGPSAVSKATGVQPVAPSPIPRKSSTQSIHSGDMPRALEIAEIKEIVGRYAEAAQRAQRAGFDAIDINAAGPYLLASFLSQAWNKRNDEYGGNLENRARFLLEVMYAIRESVGSGYPISFRLAAEEPGVDGGIRFEDTIQVAKWLEERGVDCLRASGYPSTAPYFYPAGTTVKFAEGLKSAVKIPVVAGGKIDIILGEKILKEKRADFIGIGRGFFTDPELVNKASIRNFEDIVPCIGCGICTDTVVYGDEPVKCSVNAALGRENEYRIKPASVQKHVLVVGGGPAGMTAARVAALRGHKVTLYDSQAKLGGQLNLAAIPPNKESIKNLADYLVRQIKKAKVNVVLNQEVTVESVEKIKPDAVILATGSTPFIPSIKGFDRANVVKAENALTGRAQVGRNVVIIGAELVGCETAEFLTTRDKKVMVTDIKDTIAEKMGPNVRSLLLNKLAKMGITFLTGVKYEALTDKGLIVITKEGEKRTLEADTIVIAAGSQCNIKLYSDLQVKVPEIHLAGDCVEPRTIRDAIADGYRIGLRA